LLCNRSPKTKQKALDVDVGRIGDDFVRRKRILRVGVNSHIEQITHKAKKRILHERKGQ
jgi:hypothetical protein